jgi:hypothetical protein
MNRSAAILAFGAMSMLATAAIAASAIYSPDTGILCDKKSGFCVDNQGVSLAYTEQYLGKKAAKKLKAQIDSVGVDSFDATSFTMSNGMHCETREQNCTVSKGSDKPDPVGNVTLFGKSATAAPAAAAPVYSPYKGVLCDSKSGFCADDQGISMGLTEEYLGKPASDKLMAEINKVGMNSFDATTFTMSNGVHCETKARNCTVSKSSNKPDGGANAALFGK